MLLSIHTFANVSLCLQKNDLIGIFIVSHEILINVGHVVWNVWKWLIKIIIIVSLNIFVIWNGQRLNHPLWQFLFEKKHTQMNARNLFKWRRCASITNMQLIFKIISTTPCFNRLFVLFWVLPSLVSVIIDS